MLRSVDLKSLLYACGIVAYFAGAASAATYDPLPGNGVVVRTANALGYAVLMGSDASLTNYSAYAVPVTAGNPGQTFQGTLTLNGLSTSGKLVEAGTHARSFYADPGHLPPFSFQFIQDGTHIFPLVRGLIVTSHPDWHYILEPGRVWSETGDKGYARAAIPFALQERGANCTHNGVMSFIFKSDGAISKVAFQIAAETCPYFKFDMWGLAAATYTPQAIADAASAIAAYEAEVAARMPTRPISALGVDFPAAKIIPANIGSEQTAGAMTVFGVATDGVNYVGGCESRHGTYPYCSVMDLPSYSLAKSLVGAIGLMRLEKKYAGTQNALTIQSRVAPCAGAQWNDVTLLNALDMTTGNYASSGYEVDEGSPGTLANFFSVATYRGKVAHACSYKRMSAPGTRWVYHSSDTFLLGAAIAAVYERREGSGKDYYRDMLVAEIWKPLGMSPTSWTSARTIDGAAYPLAGYGLTLLRDDLVKIGEFLNKDNASIGGTQMLDSTLYSQAMQRTAVQGRRAGGENSRYLHGFWAWNAASMESGAAVCPRAKWIPYMSGFGGIGVVLVPNNMVYYFVSDNHEYAFRKALIELKKIRNFCT